VGKCHLDIPKANHHYVSELITTLNEISNGKIYLHCRNYAMAQSNTPFGLAVKCSDLKNTVKALSEIIGNIHETTEHYQFDLFRFSGILGTHLNAFEAGKLELQGQQVGEVRQKRFPVDSDFVLGGLVDLVAMVTEQLGFQQSLSPSHSAVSCFSL
jgi:hypothetical protein